MVDILMCICFSKDSGLKVGEGARLERSRGAKVAQNRSPHMALSAHMLSSKCDLLETPVYPKHVVIINGGNGAMILEHI